jgi:ribosomal protein S15P/S13E
MGLNTSVQQFVERLNELNRYLLYFPEENPKQLDQNEIIEILDQAKDTDPEWDEAMVNANIDIFEMSHEKSESYFKCLENLEKIRRTNGLNPSSLPVDNKKSVTSIVGKSSKNHKRSNMWCHYCDKNNHNMADCRAIAKFKQQKKARFEAKAGPGKKSFAFLFEEINALKRHLKPEKTTSSKKKKPESILSTEINLTTSSDKDE